MYVERNKFIVIKIKYETWIAKQFIATEVLQWPLSIPLATQTHLPLQDTRILTWWWPPEAETCRLIIKISYISCNKLFGNSCLVFNLNYYKFVVLDLHTLLFSILVSTTGMIHLNNNTTIAGINNKEQYECEWHRIILTNYIIGTSIFKIL